MLKRGALFVVVACVFTVSACSRIQSVRKKGEAQSVKTTASRCMMGKGQDKVIVVSVWGTYEEMGYQYGKLLAPEISATLDRLLNMGISDEVLDAGFAKMKPFTPKQYLEELEGAARGCADAGHPEVTLQRLQRLAALPDVSEYGCSLFAVWGKATTNGQLYQLRSLDWNMDTGCQDFPVVTVYHPEAGQAYANVGFAGLTGVISGINANGVCVSEIMGGFAGPERLDGEPFPFVLRDVLAQARTTEEGIDIVKKARRTNKYHYGISAPQEGAPTGALIFAGPDVFLSYSDNVTPEPPGVKAFFVPLEDVVYWRFDKGQGNKQLYQSIKKRYGKIDDKGALEIAREAGTDGTLQSVLWNATDLKMWVAYAEGKEPAVKRNYVEIDLKKMFETK